jgi:hypothetical protein
VGCPSTSFASAAFAAKEMRAKRRQTSAFASALLHAPRYAPHHSPEQPQRRRVGISLRCQKDQGLCAYPRSAPPPPPPTNQLLSPHLTPPSFSFDCISLLRAETVRVRPANRQHAHENVRGAHPHAQERGCNARPAARRRCRRLTSIFLCFRFLFGTSSLSIWMSTVTCPGTISR